MTNEEKTNQELELAKKVGTIIGRLLKVLIKKGILSKAEFEYITGDLKSIYEENKNEQ